MRNISKKVVISTIALNFVFYVGSFIIMFAYKFSYKYVDIIFCIAFIMAVWGFKIFKHCPIKVFCRNYKLLNKVYGRKTQKAYFYYGTCLVIMILTLFF